MKTINIKGKEYVPVSERILAAQKEKNLLGVESEVLNHNPVVIKVTIKTKEGSFSGISAANPAKTIEKQSPYEVAETSALGRALGFAGYGIDNGIASADEIKKLNSNDEEPF